MNRQSNPVCVGFVASASPPGNKRHTGTGHANVLGHTSAGVEAENAPKAVFSAPADLRGFVQAQTVTEVARVLGMSRKTAWRLRKDMWPRDMRSVLSAWDAYKGRSTHQQSGWFLRRVHAGGVVRHASADWSAPSLALRAGQTLAIARADANTLLVQTLELPAERFTLAVKG